MSTGGCSRGLHGWGWVVLCTLFSAGAQQCCAAKATGMAFPMRHCSVGFPRPNNSKAHHHSRRLATIDGAFQLQGSIQELEYFYVVIRLGTPPKEFELIVDTGSTMTYVPCSDCKECGQNHKNGPYNPATSSSYEAVSCNSSLCACGDPDCSCQEGTCKYERNYAEQSSTTGFLVQDTLWMQRGSSQGNGSAEVGVPLVFGCTTRETGAIYSQRADGLMGLGDSNASIIYQLSQRGIIEDSFSMCMGSWDGEGALLLGDVALPSSLGPLQYIPLVPSTYNMYIVNMQNMGLHEVPLDIPPGTFQMGYGVVLDTGTTYTHLVTPAYKALVAAFMQHANSKGLKRVPGPDPQYADTDICYGGLSHTPDSRQLLRSFPTMQLYMSGEFTLRVGPLNYLFMHGKVAGAYCLGIFDNGADGTLLGGITLRNLLVQYDRRNQRVGFTHAPCRKLGNLFSDECVHNPEDRRCAHDFESEAAAIAEAAGASTP